MGRAVYVLTVRPEPGVDSIRALRAWLKIGLRTFGLKCVGLDCVNGENRAKQRRKKMDTRKYSGGVIRPEDLYDGPQVEKIVSVYPHDKHNCLVLELESGNQFFCWPNYTRILNKAWGYESDRWLEQELELSLGHYPDKKTDPPTEKETINIRAISPAKPEALNGGVPKAVIPRKKDLDDEIPSEGVEG
jgi:hypothetical protein